MVPILSFILSYIGQLSFLYIGPNDKFVRRVPTQIERYMRPAARGGHTPHRHFDSHRPHTDTRRPQLRARAPHTLSTLPAQTEKCYTGVLPVPAPARSCGRLASCRLRAVPLPVACCALALPSGFLLLRSSDDLDEPRHRRIRHHPARGRCAPSHAHPSSSRPVLDAGPSSAATNEV